MKLFQKALLTSALTLGLNSGMQAQKSTPKNKLIDGVTLLAESNATNPLGIMVNGATAGYLASVRKDVGKNTTLFLNDYFSETPGLGHNVNVKVSQDFTPESKIKTSAAAQYFISNNYRSDMMVVSAEAKMKNISAKLARWDFLNGESQNAAEISLSKEFTNKKNEYVFDAKIKLLQILDENLDYNQTVGAIELSKQLENNWSVNGSVQTDSKSNPIVGFGIVKKF